MQQRHDFVCTFNWRSLKATIVTIQSDSSLVYVPHVQISGLNGLVWML